MKQCPKCDEYEENDDTRFCGKCGAELFFVERFGKRISNSDKHVAKSNRRLMAVIIIITIIILILIFIFMR